MIPSSASGFSSSVDSMQSRSHLDIMSTLPWSITYSVLLRPNSIAKHAYLEASVNVVILLEWSEGFGSRWWKAPKFWLNRIPLRPVYSSNAHSLSPTVPISAGTTDGCKTIHFGFLKDNLFDSHTRAHLSDVMWSLEVRRHGQAQMGTPCSLSRLCRPHRSLNSIKGRRLALAP